MGNYKEVEGDLLFLALKGEFDTIAHGCNCFCTMGAGIAPQMAKLFGCDTFPMEAELRAGDIEKLGCIDYKVLGIDPVTYEVYHDLEVVSSEYRILTVVNAYTQYGFGSNHKEGSHVALDYEALTLCLRKLNSICEGDHIGLPQIGCGLAGGDWKRVKEIIKNELTNCDVTVVFYKPK